MAVIEGFDGNLTWGSIVDSDGFNTHTWSLDVVGDQHDITDFISTGFRKFNTGLKSWTGTVELYTDNSNFIDVDDVGTEATIRLHINSSRVLTGKAIVSGWHPTVTVDAVETQTLDIQGTSDLFVA